MYIYALEFECVKQTIPKIVMICINPKFFEVIPKQSITYL